MPRDVIRLNSGPRRFLCRAHLKMMAKRKASCRRRPNRWWPKSRELFEAAWRVRARSVVPLTTVEARTDREAVAAMVWEGNQLQMEELRRLGLLR